MAKKAVSKLDVIKKAIEKKYGDVIKPMSDKPLTINTVSTGSLGLDAALGRGGLAFGRIYEVFGPNSAGKSSLAMSVIKQAQDRGMNCVYVDAEHSADPKLFESMGVRIEDLNVVDLFTGEDNLAVAEMLMKSGEVDVLVVDSVTSLIPKVAADSDIEDNNIALLARLMSKTLLRYVPIAAETNTCVIFINQIRNKIGAYGNPEVSSGGEALGFYASGRIRVSGVGNKSNRIVDHQGNVIGHKTFFEIVKNKLAAPFRKASVNLIYGVGYDTVSEVISIASDLNLIGKSGSWYSYKDINIGQGENGVRAYFEEHPDVYEEIKGTIEEILGLKEHYEKQRLYDEERLERAKSKDDKSKSNKKKVKSSK